jgi:hypothetical protein
MNASRRLIVLAPLAALASRALSQPQVPFIQDRDAIPTDRALVVLLPRCEIGRVRPAQVQIGLSQVMPNKTLKELEMIQVPNGQLSMIEVEPGFYFLRQVVMYARVGLADRFEFTYDGRLTVFEARAGQINYPGDWVVDVALVSHDSMGSVSAGRVTEEFKMQLRVEEKQSVLTELRQKYPTLSATLPARLTKLRQGSK